MEAPFSQNWAPLCFPSPIAKRKWRTYYIISPIWKLISGKFADRQPSLPTLLLTTFPRCLQSVSDAFKVAPAQPNPTPCPSSSGPFAPNLMVSPLTNFFGLLHVVFTVMFLLILVGKDCCCRCGKKAHFYFRGSKMQNNNRRACARADPADALDRSGMAAAMGVARRLCQRCTCYSVRRILVQHLCICPFRFQEKGPRSRVQNDLGQMAKTVQRKKKKKYLEICASHVCFSFVPPKTLCCLGRSHATAHTSGPGHSASPAFRVLVA